MGKKLTKASPQNTLAGYDVLLADVARVIEEARRAAARSVNAVMVATYWLVGRRVVEQEQGGQARAGYGEELLARLSADLTVRFGRGFSVDNLETMRAFFLAYPAEEISETTSRKSLATRISETLSRISDLADLGRFRPSWSNTRCWCAPDPGASEYSTNERCLARCTRRQIEERRKALNR